MPDPISWSHAAPFLIAALVGGYLLGSVPFGLVVTKLAGLGDVRSIGSGNIGATNVLRTGRKDLAFATLVLDGGKGAAAVLIAMLWGPDMALVAGFGAVVGHLFPVWLKFKGGKGVATTLGVIAALAWPVGIACCVTWLLVAAAARYSSLAGLLSLASAPVFSWYILGDLQMVELTAAIAILIWFKHHENILRLLKGEETKIGQKKTE
ncbi:glycerol-3-phosphate 1-O-acyltransferase PlsY [Denitrobaculum tricleocarpae]|uniref:Glycerol-3-phosphate acyltransferase n=1 Tax=Denitrobaculum tricleocarpae TaxID=2591009 RepID=A0A545TUS5_9PROT|nr:glycerol-3-phosphate 1-O-acyltransferase PlsY [Denitrobaculum tricleocarpae]TQV80962.1 glycerol-3-phosphate 1-O-acyltransferase PlsY [Denitrobaculum tricleocarpae]